MRATVECVARATNQGTNQRAERAGRAEHGEQTGTGMKGDPPRVGGATTWLLSEIVPTTAIANQWKPHFSGAHGRTGNRHESDRVREG